jgi:hypothetical protein
MKQIINRIHSKYPFIDPAINLIFGALLSKFASNAVDEISINWHFWESFFFWVSLVTLAVAIIYWAKLSSYSNLKSNRIARAKEDLTETLIITARDKLAKSKSFEELFQNGIKAKIFIDTLNVQEEQKQ